MLFKNDVASQFLEANKKLILLEQKEPITGVSWKHTRYNDKQIFDHKGNLGWALGQYDLVIDIDPRNGGLESYNSLKNETGLALTPSVKTPSGGYHIYFSIPESHQGMKIKKNLKKYPGIDFLSQGSYCVIVGSKLPNGDYLWLDELLGCFHQEEAPEELLAALEFSSLDDSSGSSGNPNSFFWTRDKVVEMLYKIDPSVKNDEWVKVGMALKEWDEQEGLELWEDWSKSGDNYKEGETLKRWHSFKVGGNISLGSIQYMAKEIDFDKESKLLSDLRMEIKLSDRKKLELEVIPKIKKTDLSEFNRNLIVNLIRDKLKDLSGTNVKLSDVKDLISRVKVDKYEPIPEWCKKWVYINSHNSFMNLDTLSLHKQESFNLENGRFVPYREGGSKLSASKYVADNGFVRKFDAMAYLPFIDEIEVELNGMNYINKFNHLTKPKPVKEHTDFGLYAIEKVQEHINFVCNGKDYGKVLTEWLAHNIQFPGRKILWTPIIQSIEGIGKSFFGYLLRYCLGYENIGVVSPSEVSSPFNSWASGVCVNVLEELKLQGHNRYDVVNSLKPLITDEMIMINEKGVKQYSTFNTCNYICFTNHKDCLPLNDNDRRWWVIFNDLENLNQLFLYTGESAEIYFPKLFDMLSKARGDILKWLLDYPISKEFLNYKQAPSTPYKRSMIASEVSSELGLMEVKLFIHKGGFLFNERVVSSVDMFDAFSNEYPELAVETSRKNLVMRKLGYQLHENLLFIEGKQRRIWTKTSMSSKQIKSYLYDNTNFLSFD